MLKRVKLVKDKTTPEVERLLRKGDICDLYLCSWEEADKPVAEPPHKSRWDIIGDSDGTGGSKKQAILKVCRSSGDNDLTQNEIRILNLLYPAAQKDEGLHRYLCKPLSTEGNGTFDRPSLVLPYLDEYISLEDVLKAYPAGIDYRDLAWMFKRLLVAIGFAHGREVFHGAVLPSHFMVHPTEHGGKLIDWSYAVTVADHASIKAISAAWQDYYPPEVFAKRFPTAATDIYMAAKCAVALLGGDVKTNEMPDKVPESVQKLLRSCLGEVPSSRPPSAWGLHEEFKKVLFELVGKPAYRKFRMPDA